jgi:hypothetical protein
MWADTLFASERAFFVQLAVWGALSAIVGTAVVAVLARRRTRSDLVRQFAVQTAIWGTLEVTFALLSWTQLHMRDLASASRLDRTLRVAAGLEIGLILIGVVVGAVSLGTRTDRAGGGVAIAVQGAALALLTTLFLASVSVPT